MDYKKITAIPKTPVEILGEGAVYVTDFTEIGTTYTSQMLEMAKKGERLQFYPTTNEGYDYTDAFNGFFWRKEWLKDIREEVDWSKIPIDTKIIVSDCRDFKIAHKRYFAKYEDGKVYAWDAGTTSWSAEYYDYRIIKWSYAKLAPEAEGNIKNRGGELNQAFEEKVKARIQKECGITI